VSSTIAYANQNNVEMMVKVTVSMTVTLALVVWNLVKLLQGPTDDRF
jgi:Flp pilus assembly protein TadG